MPSRRQIRRPRSSRALILALATATLSIHLFLAHFLNREFGESRDLARAAERSRLIRDDLINVLSLHQDVETGQRGYLLTGDTTFLAPYRATRARVATTASAVMRSTPRPSVSTRATLGLSKAWRNSSL